MNRDASYLSRFVPKQSGAFRSTGEAFEAPEAGHSGTIRNTGAAFGTPDPGRIRDIRDTGGSA